MLGLLALNELGKQIPDDGESDMAAGGGDKLKVTQSTKVTGQVDANKFEAKVAKPGGGAGNQKAGKSKAGKQKAGNQKAG